MDDIELGLLNGSSDISSASSEETIFQQDAETSVDEFTKLIRGNFKNSKNVRYQDVGRVHHRKFAKATINALRAVKRVPFNIKENFNSASRMAYYNPKNIGGAVLGAGSAYFGIFNAQIGTAAAAEGNPLGDSFYKAVYGEGATLEQTAQQDYDNHKLRANGVNIRIGPPEWKQWLDQHNKLYNHDHLLGEEHKNNIIKEELHILKGRMDESRAYYTPEKQKEIRDGLSSPLFGFWNTWWDKYSTLWKEHGITLPLSRNIGPLNKIQSPANEADAVAREHDLHYMTAETPEEVREADKLAITEFTRLAQSATNPITQVHAIIGALGLLAKYTTETLTGVKYGNYGLLSSIITSSPPAS